MSAQEALKVLRRICEHEHHMFWPDDVPLNSAEIPASQIMGHRQFTDAYLLGLAIRKGGGLVTLDDSVSYLLPVGDERQAVIELIGTEK